MKGYKFRPNFKEPKHKMLLTEGKIWFASSKDFNDPFDCQIPLRYDLESIENRRKVIQQLFENSEPNSTKQEIINKVNSVADAFSDEDTFEQFCRDKEKSVAERLGIFSMAGDFRNILLWGHYANGHRGYCIEYDREILADYFLKQLQDELIIVTGYRIEYHDIFPILIPSQLEGDKVFIKQFCIKYKDWSYEREFRLFAMDKANSTWPIPKEAITGVIIGCEMNREEANSVKEAVSAMKHSPNLTKALRTRDSYELQFERLDY